MAKGKGGGLKCVPANVSQLPPPIIIKRTPTQSNKKEKKKEKKIKPGAIYDHETLMIHECVN